MFSSALLTSAASCERKLDALECPCISGYECCAFDNRCHPEGQGCGASSRTTGGTSNGEGASGAEGESENVAGAGGSSGESQSESSGAAASRAGSGAVQGALGGAAGRASSDPKGSPVAFPRFCSMSGWCGAKNTFAAAWSSRAGDVWVASNDRETYANNSLARWDGQRWQNYDEERDSWGRVLAIGGSGPDDVWFVGEDSGHARAFHFDGSGFAAMYLEAGELRGVWASAPDDVWSVGVQGYALHYDGEAWTSELAPSFTHDLNAVWGSASDDVLAVGSNGVVARWDGVAWSLEREDPGVELVSVWGSRASDVWAVGAGATVLHYDGESWSARDLGLAELADVDFVAVTGTSDTDVWLAERGGRLVHFDGAEFRVVATDASGTLAFEALAPAGERDVWAFGERGFAARCELARCVDSAPATFENLYAVWGRATDDVWAVGESGTLVHFDGDAWQRTPSPTTADLRAIHGTPDGQLWAAGDALLRYDGSAWSLVRDEETALHAVFALAADDVWIAGDASTLRHFDGEAWVDFDASDAGETLTGLWGSAADDVWAVGVGGTNLHFDGTSWSEVETPEGIHFGYQVVSGTARDNVFIHGWYVEQGEPSFGEGRFDGRSWTFEGGAYGAALSTFGKPASWAVGPREVWLVSGTDAGFSEIYRLGSTIQGDSGGTDDALYGVWGASPRQIWVVGAGGAILEKVFAPAPL